MTPFGFTLHGTDGAARRGTVHTARGDIRTPAFMPVGTAATVKAMTMDRVRETGADIILGNTYHLMLRPTAERIARLGGLHQFSRWDGPILTDSGGFQVMSLAALRRLDDDGVVFKSHIDGSEHAMSPERSIEIQGLLGSDIQMQLDELVSLPNDRGTIERAMERSLRWAERCAAAFGDQPERAMFGIVQGGDQPDLRRRSAGALAAIDLKGYAIGGLAVGEDRETMLRIVETTEPHLPRDKPRYMMGVGTPWDLLQSVARGVDMFDCVLPTRSGRHGLAWTTGGRVNLRNARHTDDPRPLDPTVDCPASRDYSRAYLNHLVRANEILGMVLLTWHNLAYYQHLMAGIRDAIERGAFEDFAAQTVAGWEHGDIEPIT